MTPRRCVEQTNPAFFPMMPDAEFDSFLTIGIDGPALLPGALSTIGVDFTSWSETNGIRTDNGAVRAPDLRHVLSQVCSRSADSAWRAVRRYSLWIQNTAARQIPRRQWFLRSLRCDRGLHSQALYLPKARGHQALMIGLLRGWTSQTQLHIRPRHQW